MKNTAFRLGTCRVTILLLASSCGSSKLSSPNDGGADAMVIRLDVLPSGADTRPGADLPGPVPGTDARDLASVGDLPGTPVSDTPIGTGADAPAPDTRLAPDAGLPQPNPDGGGSVCGLAGAACLTAADCCGLACLAGVCSVAACRSDGASCTSGGQCCSSTCSASGVCAALNPTCKTAGNACTSDGECCNHSCNANHQCAQPGQVSYCNQTGDICRADVECCTGVCNIASGAAVGTCATISTSCQVDGTVCSGCGVCCSHFCGPFGAGGPDICQPASGCRIQGDLCHKDSDCCGGDALSGLPGAGLVKCELDPTYGSRIGTCGGPVASNCPNGTDTCKNSCNPEGNVCHWTNTAVCEGSTTSKRNDCCACISGKECCQLDPTGIPRCNALAACVPVGGNCAFSGDCCNHEPCLPDPITGHLTCGSTCVPLGGLCTTNADCCIGTLCQVSPGSLAGTCVIPPPPPPKNDAGVPPTNDGSPPGADTGQPQPDDALAPEPDGAVPEPDTAPPICAYFGQACSISVPCCGGTSCVNSAFYDCTATDTDCVCFAGE
jgi:hypothetical protein